MFRRCGRSVCAGSTILESFEDDGLRELDGFVIKCDGRGAEDSQCEVVTASCDG